MHASCPARNSRGESQDLALWLMTVGDLHNRPPIVSLSANTCYPHSAHQLSFSKRTHINNRRESGHSCFCKSAYLTALTWGRQADQPVRYR